MMARRRKRSTLWDVLLRYLSGLVYFLSCLNPLHYLPQGFTEALNGKWSESVLAFFQTETSRKRQLLRWVQEKVPDKHPRDWTGSWADGTLLCALVEALVPGTCPRYDLLNPSQGLNNARLGLKLAERNLGVAQLIAPEEIADSRLQSSDRLARYVSRLRQVSMRMESPNGQSKRVVSPQVSLDDTVVRDICTVSGSGLTTAEVNREATFNIFARSDTIIDFEVQIKVPTGQVTSERVRQRAGLSVETFNQIFLEHKRKHVIQTRTNQKGRPRPRREQDTDKVYVGFVCTHDGFFQVGYTPKKAGFHLITVLWMGSPVEGCPFRVRVQDSSLEKNKMVMFKDQQEITTPKIARRAGGSESTERVPAEVPQDDGGRRPVQQSSTTGSEAGAPSEDSGYVGGTYRRRIVKQPSGGSDSSTQEMNERKKTLIKQGSGNQEQSGDSDVSEGAFRRRVIRQESSGSVDVSDSETTEPKKGGQRGAKMERQNSASGIVTKRKVLNITVMGEDISDASRRASIFKSSSSHSQGSFMSQQSSDRVDQAGEETKGVRWKSVSVEDKAGQCGTKDGKKKEAGWQKESAIEAMSKKLSSEVIVDSFGELAVKVRSKGVDDEAVKARRRTLMKQSSLIPYLKEEGPYVIPSWVQDTPQNSNSNVTVSENKRQKLVHQSSLIPYLKENGQPDEINNTSSTDLTESPKHDDQRVGLPTQAAPSEPHAPRKSATASRHRVLTRQSSLVPYMKSASDEGLTASPDKSTRQLQETPEVPVSIKSSPIQKIPKDDEVDTSDGQRNTEKRSVPKTTRRLVKQSSLIPYMKLASVMSEAVEESPEGFLESNAATDSIGSEYCLEIDVVSSSIASDTSHKEEDPLSHDRLLSLQEFLAMTMEAPNGMGSSSQIEEGAFVTGPQKSTNLRPVMVTDDTLMSLKEFLSLSMFDQMQAINLMQKSRHQTKVSVELTEECTDLNTTVEGTTEETLLSLKEFLAMRIQEASVKETFLQTAEANGSQQPETMRDVSDDALITLKEFLSLRDIAERNQPMSISKEASQKQQHAETNIFNDHEDEIKTRSDQISQELPELTVGGSEWKYDIKSFQNPFVTNLLTINTPQDECQNTQDDLLMGSLDVFDERNKNSSNVFSTEQSLEHHSGSSQPLWSQVKQEERAKENELNVVHDLIDIGSGENTLPPVQDASSLDANTVESSKAEDQGKNGPSRRNGQNRATLTRQSSLVPYLKQAEERETSAPASKELSGHKDFLCDVITETEDAERSCISDRPSVSTLVKNWEEVTRSADDMASGQHQMSDIAGNGSNFPTANDSAIVGKASLLENPLDGLEAIVFSDDRDREETFFIVADVQIEAEEHGGHMDVLNTIMAQLNHVDSPVTGVMYDSDLENMDMNQEWMIIDTDPTLQPKNITPAMTDNVNEASRRMTVRYRSEILVDIGSEYELESPRKSPVADEETRVDGMSLNSGGLVRQKGNQYVKSASERKMSFMADDGNFPSLFVTTVDDPHGEDVQNTAGKVPTPSSDGIVGQGCNQINSSSSSSLLMMVPNTGTRNGSTGDGDQVSCHWSVMSADPTNQSSAIQFKPAENSTAFLPSVPKDVHFQSIFQQERGQPGMMYRNSLTLEVNQDHENSPQQSDGNMLRAEPHRHERRRRPIRESFRKAVVDKEDEIPDDSSHVLVSDCIERDALNSGYVDSYPLRSPTRVDCSHKSLQVHSHQIRKETGYQESMREDVRRRQGAIGGVSSIRNLLRSVDEKVSELSDIASEVMHNSSQHRNSLAEALRAAARKTSGELGAFDDDDDVARRTTRQSTDDSGISDVTIYVDGKGPYTWQERHNISSLEDRIPYWLLNDNESDSSFSPDGLRVPNESLRASKSDSECVIRRPERAGIPESGPDCRRRSNVSLPDTESMHDFTAQLATNDTFANMRPAGRRYLPGESASIRASRQSWAGFPHSIPRRLAFSPAGDGYEAGDEPNEEDEGDIGTSKADGRSRSRVLASRILAFGPGLDHGFVGAKNNFQVSTRNAGNGALNVSLVGPRKNTVAEVNVIYTGDDLYEVIYDVTQPGYYVLSVKWMDRNVPESPFIVKVSY
ncbi:FLNC [Branchiostoma lanceolatum]|uniref:FLNC protein n=1 Tax=Branchiostoma lanceolatum TaxID=7740 RepID=A0A8K0EL13_BRALA|nr:FLNC [Branchiostoma lanceolatum]